jgi:hypothetical protein
VLRRDSIPENLAAAPTSDLRDPMGKPTTVCSARK